MPKYKRIELATKAAHNGDETAVRVLTDEIFALAPEIPQEVRGPLEERVVRAELEFRKEQHAPISEAGIANGVNLLADHFGAPEFAKTSEEQVSDLRMNLIPAFPTLLASRLGSDNSTIHQFSPAEAAFLTLVMARQKVSNARYQVTPEQWKAARKLGHTAGPSPQAIRAPNPQAEQMRNLIAKGGSHMSATDAIALGHQVFDAVGLQR